MPRSLFRAGLHLGGEGPTGIGKKCIDEESRSNVTQWFTDSSDFLLQYKKLRGAWKDNIEQHTAEQTLTGNGFSATLKLSGMDGEECGRPMGLPHSRLHVMWPLRRRCDSAGKTQEQSEKNGRNEWERIRVQNSTGTWNSTKTVRWGSASTSICQQESSQINRRISMSFGDM